MKRKLTISIVIWTLSMYLLPLAALAEDTTDTSSIPADNQDQPEEVPSDDTATTVETPGADAVPTDAASTETDTEGTSITTDETIAMDPEPAVAAPPAPVTQQPVIPEPRRRLDKRVENPRTSPRKLMFLLGPGFSLGFFYPKDVGSLIGDYANAEGADLDGMSTENMILNLVPRFSLSFAPIEYVQIEGLGEIGYAPKILAIVGGDSETFHFTRFAVGGLVNGHIPLRQYKSALFIGGGVLYNWLIFRGGPYDYVASTLGGRAQIGFRWHKKSAFVPEILLTFDYVKPRKKTEDSNNTENPSAFLNYTGVTLGANFYFNVTPHTY